LPREVIAYTLIAAIALGGAVWSGIAWRRHVRRKLRLRGIKDYGH